MSFQAINNNYITQASWFIDPSAGNDGYDGTNGTFTSGVTGPLKTWKELVRRWGTISPILRQSTTITFMSSHTDNTDPVRFAPYIANQSIIAIVGNLGAAQQVATGTIGAGAITAKNRTTGQLFTVVLTSGLAVGQLIVNSSVPSRAWIYKNAGVNTWSLSQPLVPINPSTFNGTVTQNDASWATGNTYIVYNPVAVNIVHLAPRMVDINQTTFGNSLHINSLIVFDPNVFDPLTIDANSTVVISECASQRYIQCGLIESVLSPQFINNDFRAGFVGGSVGNSYVMAAGQIRGSNFSSGSQLNNDIIIGANSTMNVLSYGNIYVDTSITLTVGSALGQVNPVGSPIVWGPGTLNINNDIKFVIPSGVNATSTLPITNLKINGFTTASAYNPAGIGTFVDGITLTAANLDLALSSGGFGGIATVVGGGVITKNVLPTGSGTLSYLSTITSPTISQTASASTSGASGSNGQVFALQAQAGQAATGASHNGGNGGNLTLAAGVGGTSGSATAGIGGVIALTGGQTASQITIISASYSVDTNSTTSDYIVLVNRAGAVSITLPTPTAGRVLIFKDASGAAGSNNITINHHSAETIDGANTFVINTNFGFVMMVSNGTNWFIV